MKKTLMTAFFLAILAGCSSSLNELPSFAQNDTQTAPVVLSGDRILKVLGEPTVKRRENPDEVWVYTREQCVLFIYMNSAETAVSHVTHMEIGKASQKSAAKESAACLNMASRLMP